MNRKKTRTKFSRAIADIVIKLTKPVFAKRGFADGSIVRDWQLIVGPMLAKVTRPVRIISGNSSEHSGTLVLHVANGSAATEIQHNENFIRDQINTYFGFSAVKRIRLIQTFFQIRTDSKYKKLTSLKTNESPVLATKSALESLDDLEMKNALLSLGLSVAKRCANRKIS